MTDAQRHRGPDGGAVEALRPDAALGHRRLAILDLSNRGRQPMKSRDGRWTIAFNGEIFNYRELRAELPAHPWRSETDTEVFLEAIASWGIEKTLERSIGMFAAALWDAREESLLLVRDRIGEKPLVYFWNGSTLAFANEMKALAGLHESRLDPAALDAYLALGFIPAPLGVFRSTYKLPAGHFARLKDGRLDVRRWWFPEQAKNNPAVSPEERREQLRALIGDAVRIRLRADVPVSLALSGGIDSSVIAAEMACHGVAPETFTVVFDGDASDLVHAQEVACRFGLRHTAVPADPGHLGQRLSAAIKHYDEPFADSSSMGCLALASAVSGRSRVILDGDGGDEAFGGYRHYEFAAAKAALKTAAAAVGLKDGHVSSSVYVQSKVLFRASERATLLNGHGARGLEEILGSDAYLRAARHGALKRALWHDRHLYLANGLTFKMDIALGAHGIEGRAPFLDHRILEWSQNLPDRDLVRGRKKKVLLRETYADLLPAAVLARKKRGFGAPIHAWLDGPLREAAHDLLPCPVLEAAGQRGLTGQRRWAAFVLAKWAREWRATW